MALTREYGYREYEDDLVPGKGGESNLLYKEGRLETHAPFFKTYGEGDQDSPKEGVSGGEGFSLGVMAAAVVAGVIWSVPRLVRAVQARRRTTNDVSESPEVADVEASAAAPEHAESVDADPDEELIEEVESLIGGASATAERNGKRSHTPQDEDFEPTTRAEAARRTLG